MLASGSSSTGLCFTWEFVARHIDMYSFVRLFIKRMSNALRCQWTHTDKHTMSSGQTLPVIKDMETCGLGSNLATVRQIMRL